MTTKTATGTCVPLPGSRRQTIEQRVKMAESGLRLKVYSRGLGWMQRPFIWHLERGDENGHFEELVKKSIAHYPTEPAARDAGEDAWAKLVTEDAKEE